VEYIKGLENPTESIQNIVRWMVKHGHPDGEITNVMGENVHRLLKEVW